MVLPRFAALGATAGLLSSALAGNRDNAHFMPITPGLFFGPEHKMRSTNFGSSLRFPSVVLCMQGQTETPLGRVPQASEAGGQDGPQTETDMNDANSAKGQGKGAGVDSDSQALMMSNLQNAMSTPGATDNGAILPATSGQITLSSDQLSNLVNTSVKSALANLVDQMNKRPRVEGGQQDQPGAETDKPGSKEVSFGSASKNLFGNLGEDVWGSERGSHDVTGQHGVPLSKTEQEKETELARAQELDRKSTV